MPQKKAKKAKIEKPKKAVKPAAPQKKVAGGSVLKKAAKVVAKKLGAAALSGSAAKKKPQLAVKDAKKPTLPAKPLKETKLDKKAGGKEVKKAPAPASAPSKADLKKAAKESAKLNKGKGVAPVNSPAPAVAPAGKAGKKKGEIVLEMPAPKGVALLGREGKKKSKAEASVSSRKNRCREPGCEHETLLSGFCRLHYIKNWRKIKRKEAILASGQLNNYVEELVSKYPDKYLDVIRQDLASEKEWAKVVIDLELESTDEEGAADEDMEGVAEGTGRREREFDDDSDTF